MDVQRIVSGFPFICEVKTLCRLETIQPRPLLSMEAGTDWATCQPGTCQVGRLVRRPRGPPRHVLKQGMERWKGPYIGREGSARNYLEGRFMQHGPPN